MTPGPVTPASDPVVIAALKALEWPTSVEECAKGFEGEIYFGSYLASVQNVVAAVRPLIEAEAAAKWADVVKKGCIETAEAVRVECNAHAAQPLWRRWVGWLRTDETTAEWLRRTTRNLGWRRQ